MKKAVIFLLLAGALTLIAGCQKKETAAAAAPAEIVQWGWNAGEIERIFAEYCSQTGTALTLNYSAVAQQEVFQKLQTTASAGLDMPDIVPSEISQRGTMMSLDLWEDLSKAPYGFSVSTFFPYQEALCKNEKGELVALPWDISSAALAYKRDLAQQYLGVSEPAEVQAMLPTWNAFIEKGIRLQQDTSGKVFMFASLTNIFQIASGQNPSPIVANNRLDLDPVRKTLEMIVRFRDNKISDNIIESAPAYNASYVDDLHIFYPCAGWSPNYQIIPNDPQGPTHTWGLIVPPEGCFSWGGTGHMIPKAGKNKLEGFKFVSWLISKEGAVWQQKEMEFYLSNREAFQDPEIASMYNSYFESQNLGDILFGAIETINVRPVSPYDVTIQDTYNLVIENLNSDRSLGFDQAAALWETEFRNKAADVQ
jgi:multiple sugar transport system substrate-binding protein